MTTLSQIIARVKELDENAERAPWKSNDSAMVVLYGDEVIADCLGDQEQENADLVAYYRNITPKMARALEVAVDYIANVSAIDEACLRQLRGVGVDADKTVLDQHKAVRSKITAILNEAL